MFYYLKRSHVYMIILLLASSGSLMAQGEGLEFFGTIYTKWLDGDRLTNNALYNASEIGNGDVGQGTEFELLFRSKVSKQVEIGGRIKARFDQNFWTNGGGFAADENEPRSAQYMKFRGAYVRLTPGYSWLDSATIGSNDWGQFDAFTIGKMRYIDRDNVSGLLFQGSGADKKFRWDLARVSLPKLWAGPEFTTGPLHQKDAAYGLQMKYDVNPNFNISGIYKYANDIEIDPLDVDNRDGVETSSRHRNTIIALKAEGSAGSVDLKGKIYSSDTSINNDFVNSNSRFSPTLTGDESDEAIIANIDINDIGFGNLTLGIEYFDIGAGFNSVFAARRESDVLLTEGHDGAWGWSRPDYNLGSNDRGNSRAGIGYGGWDGHAAQVVNIAADNAFTDFDEQMAESVIGWKGYTIVPSWSFGELEMSAEYTYIDYNTNWQACGGSSAADCIYPRMDGVRSWGLGGDWRSVYQAYQDKETTIWLIKGDYLWDVGEGVEIGFKYKVIDDEDNRVTDAAFLDDAYNNAAYPDFVIDSVNYDDRDADYTSYSLDIGYQISEDVYGSFHYANYEAEIFDGTVDMRPPLMETWEPEFGWIQYLTGDHDKDHIAIKIKYFLSGMEFGLNAQWINGTYSPKFFRGENGSVVEFQPTGGAVNVPVIPTPVSTDDVDFEHYRLKAFMKVQF